MKKVSPFNLPEIQAFIVHHLGKKTLLQYGIVSATWHSIIRSELWRSAVFDAKGPFLDDWNAHHMIGYIETLEYHIGAFGGLMPTQGFTRLTSLKIVRPRGQYGRDLEVWPSLSQLLQNQSMADCSLIAMEVNSTRGTTEFWDALATHRLKSLSLSHIMLPRPFELSFWKIFRSVETLNIRDARSRICPLVCSRLFQLKHLDMEDCTIKSENPQARPWLCSPYLESVRYIHSATSVNQRFELSVMAADIQEATVAAAEGRNHYDQDKGHGEDVEQYRGVIPGKNLHSIEFGRMPARTTDLDIVINNVDALQKLCVPYLPLGLTTFGALMRHAGTLVELNLRSEAYMTDGILALMQLCPKLESLSVSQVDIGPFFQNRRLGCTGLKRLSMFFGSPRGEQDAEEESTAIFRMLSQLRSLQFLDTLPHDCDQFSCQWVGRPRFGLHYGLFHLAESEELQEVHGDFSMFGPLDAKWAVKTWPKLKKVGFYERRGDLEMPPDSQEVFKARGVSMASKQTAIVF